jgi:hypothetical protein
MEEVVFGSEAANGDGWSSIDAYEGSCRLNRYQDSAGIQADDISGNIFFDGGDPYSDCLLSDIVDLKSRWFKLNG